MYFHQTIRRYVATMLETFSKVKTQYLNSKGDLIEKNIPVFFYNREKSSILDHVTSQNMIQNINAIPRAYLVIDSYIVDYTRMRNRNTKINISRSDGSIEYQYNSTPFTFNFSYIVLCRGHGEATQIIEEIVPIFNPTLALDVYDCDGLDTPTRVLAKFLDVSVEPEGNEQYSSNLITVTFGIELQGWIYQPIKSTDKVKELLMRYHTLNDCFMLDYDVDTYPKINTQEKLTKESALASLNIKDIEGSVSAGMNYLTLKYTYQKGDSIDIEWSILEGNANIINVENDKCQISATSDFIITVKITDYFLNEVSITREYKI